MRAILAATAAAFLGISLVADATAAEMSPELKALVAEAKKEGALTLAWSQDVMGGADGAKQFESAINKAYGTNIAIKFVPSIPQPALASKIVTEAAAGQKATSDVYLGANYAISTLTERHGLIPTEWTKLLPGRVTPDLVEEGGQAVRFATGFPGVTYNTEMVPPAHVPQKLADLLDPWWKGKLASTVYAASFEAISSPDMLGYQGSLDYIKKLAPQLSGLLRCGDGERIATGEYAALALDCSSQQATFWKRKGAPIAQAQLIDAGQLRYWYVGVPKNAEHPAAAKLWIAYSLTPEGQALVRKTWDVDLDSFPEAPDHGLAAEMKAKGAKMIAMTIPYWNAHTDMDKAKDEMVKILRTSKGKAARSAAGGGRGGGGGRGRPPPLAKAPPSRGARDPMPAAMLAVVVAASALILFFGVVVVWLSLSNALPGVAEHRFTFENYIAVFTSAETYTVLWNTAWFSAAAVLVACGFGIPLAWLVERTDLRAKTAVFTIMTMGLLIPNFSVAMGWIFLMQPRIGVLNRWAMSLFGLDSPPFDIATIFGMGWVEGLALAPLTFIMTAALFRLMDPTLEEAAAASGANYRQTFVRVTLPLIWPGVLAAMLYTFVIGFAAFDVPAIIGWSKRIFTFSTQMYLYVTPAVELPRYGPAAAFGAAMIPVAIGMSVWYGRVQRHAARYQVVTGRGYRPRLVRLGRWGWAGWGFLALYLFLGQAIPVLALVWSSLLAFFRPPSLAALQSVSLANFDSLPWVLVKEGMRNTALLIVLTPTCVIALSLAFSWIVVRSKVRGRAVFDFFAFLPHAVPGVIFAIGALLIALFVLRGWLPVYNTIWLILGTYVIVRLSYGTRVLNSALSQIHAELEEAGRVAGASTWQVFRTVVLPILTPAMMYAWLWVALLSYRELTLATLLAGEDNATMAVVVWGLWLSGGLGRASALTVIVLLLFTPLLALYWFMSRRANALSRV